MGCPEDPVAIRAALIEPSRSTGGETYPLSPPMAMTGAVRHRTLDPVFQVKIMEAKKFSRIVKLRADGGPDEPGSRFAGGEAGLDARVRNTLSNFNNTSSSR